MLFAVDAYEAVAEAYLKGLERRLAEGKSLDIASVASFFVSRIDTAVDKRLEGKGHDELLGTAAIANARNAYRSFERIFGTDSPRWDALHHAGAHPQRPLWASTGVKNPAYKDTMYVDELIGAAHGQHDAAGDARGGRRPRHDLRADRDAQPRRDAAGAGAGRDRSRRGHRTNCWTPASSSSRTRCQQLLDGIEERRKSYKEKD